MPVSAAVLQRAAAAARRWRRVTVKTLRSHLTTPYAAEIRLPLTSSESPVTSQPLVSIRVESNHEEIMRWCQLEYFGFCQPVKKTGDFSEDKTSEVCVHVGPPRRLGYPYALTAETDNFADAVRRDEMHAVWENSEGVESAYPTRWLTQLLLDGFVSRRVAAHVGLSADHMVETVAAARQLKVPLTPREVSPYYFANNLLSSWGIFGDIKLDDAESVRGSVSHIIQMAHAASIIPIRRSVWLNGAAICNGRGDAVVILGPKMSGKTTLALHCLSEDAAHLRLIGLENFHLAAESSVLSGEDSPTGYQRALLSGVPTSATVGVGALMGSLRPNPSLVRAAHNFDCSSATIQCLMRNSEEVIWFMDRKHSVNINEAFGPHHWCPTWFGRLRGIILLNWDIQELSRPTSSASMRLNHWSERADCVKVLRAFAQSKRSALLKGHYLVRSIYDELRAQSQLEEVLFFGNDVPPVFELRGAVHFDAAVNLICHRLLKQVNS